MRLTSPAKIPALTASLPLITLVVLSGGCASTEIMSFKDPDFVDARYRRLLVLAEDVALDLRNEIETQVVDALGQTGTAGIVGMSVILPTRTYDGPEGEAEIARRLGNAGVDGVLRIVLAEETYEQQYVPPTYGYWSPRWGDPYVGGFYQTYPLLRFETRLEDRKTGKNAWIASSVTTGNAADDKPAVLAASLARALVKRLADEGLILPANSQREIRKAD